MGNKQFNCHILKQNRKQHTFFHKQEMLYFVQVAQPLLSIHATIPRKKSLYNEFSELSPHSYIEMTCWGLCSKDFRCIFWLCSKVHRIEATGNEEKAGGRCATHSRFQFRVKGTCCEHYIKCILSDILC